MARDLHNRAEQRQAPIAPKRGVRSLRSALLVGLAVSAIAAVAVWWTTSQSRTGYLNAAKAGAKTAHFVDETRCGECHARQREAWTGSHHAVAMRAADSSAVLGDFSNATFTHDGGSSRFFRRNGGFWINAQGPDGVHRDFRVQYTFGVDPLQQYLLDLPGGRLQAFTVAW